MTPELRGKIERGIAAYAREQKLLLRLLRRYGSFTSTQFDAWFRDPLNRKRGRRRKGYFFFGPVTPDTFILGLGRNGFNQWAKMLYLLQHMMRLDMVDAKQEGSIVTYSLPKTS